MGLAQGQTVGQVSKQIGVAGQTYYRCRHFSLYLAFLRSYSRTSPSAPSNGRGLKRMCLLPVCRSITAPIGNDTDMLASRLLMCSSSQTQPRWKSGSCKRTSSA